MRKATVLATSMLLCTTSAFAANINLSEIEFSTANNGYIIVLKTDKQTSFKKTVQNDDKLVLELKNTAVTEDFATIYNEVSDINNITITPVGKDDLRIQIQGSNVDKSQISMDYPKNAPLQNFEPNQINLNMPMENYKPVYNETELEEVETGIAGTSALAKLNPSTIAQNLNKVTENEQYPTSTAKWLTYVGLIIIMITACRNIFKTDKEAQIGLAQSLKSREKEIAEKLNAGVKETLSLRSKIAQNASAPSISYGLRSYQNAQKNPYENISTPIRPVRKGIKPQTYPQTQLKSKTQTAPKVTATYKKPFASPVTTTMPKREINVDSMKFLESMTKIYEKNGRADLAMGLKNNINKVNL